MQGTRHIHKEGHRRITTFSLVTKGQLQGKSSTAAGSNVPAISTWHILVALTSPCYIRTVHNDAVA